ncbi:MAG: DNA-directed RNA polymerase subunit E [Thermoplasmata archaeon]|nr:DNA-directed RNA polymerase subunit E [Thermoplasmata archaeon]
MPQVSLRACKTCLMLTEADKCPRCGTPTTRDWQGYLIVVDHTKSEIAKMNGRNENGRYALRVR